MQRTAGHVMAVLPTRLCWLMTLTMVLSAGTAGAQNRFAFVLGNSDYADKRLQNPGNDADAVEAALQDLGFTVAKHKDLDQQKTEAAICSFGATLTKRSVAFFFYSGHGVQVDGENYLVPIGAKLDEEVNLKHKCVPVSYVLDVLAKSESTLNVVVLDCCRDNPFQRSWKSVRPTKGLAAIGTAPRGTLIAFATASGETAEDGSGNNSPYTRSLCDVLKERTPNGLELRDAFNKVGLRVQKETGQVPWIHTPPLEPFYLWTGPKTPPVTISNSIGMKLVPIRAGKFEMGSPGSEAGRDAQEEPLRAVRIERPFLMGLYEVSQAEYTAVMNDNPSCFQGDHERLRYAGVKPDELPVERVTWYDALAFCNALSRREGLAECYRLEDLKREDGVIKYAKVTVLPVRGYRLPTEAEWEYACRAGTTTPFSFGAACDARQANCNGTRPYGQTVQGHHLKRTESCDSYEPNAWGLFNMHGNVSEWCADGSDTSRWHRGGSWMYEPAFCRSASRGTLDPGDRASDIGFRVVIDAEGP